MGLCNSAATFQRLINTILEEFIREGFVIVYMDEILIHSPYIATHKKHVDRVIEKILEKKLKIKRSKCDLVKSEAKFLGYIISHGLISTDPEKIKAFQVFRYHKHYNNSKASWV